MTAIGVLARQLRNPLLILLLAAAGVSAATGDTTVGAVLGCAQLVEGRRPGPMSDDHVEFLFQAARSAIESGEPFPAQFLIPVDERRWRVIAHDLAAVGENDLGIPPRAFAYGAVGMLLASLGAQQCYAAEAAAVSTPPDLGSAPRPSEDPSSRQAVVVTVFARGQLDIHVQPYGRDDDGRVLWGAPTAASTKEPGALGAAVPLWRAVNRQPTPLPPPEELIEDMVESGFVVLVEA